MTGREMLNEKLKEKGANKAQIEAHVVDWVLEILSEDDSGTYIKLTEAKRELEEAKRKLLYIQSRITGVKDEYQREVRKYQGMVSEYKEKMTDIYNEVDNYIKTFNQSLMRCVSEEGRDAMRAAQMFVNTVNVDTKYDNTAFIIGLSAILSGAKIEPITELRKINKNLPMGVEDFIFDDLKKKYKGGR